MDDNILKTLDDLKLQAETANSYMITLTILRAGKLEHHLLLNNFPNMDCLPSHVETEKLIVEHLKKVTIEDAKMDQEMGFGPVVPPNIPLDMGPPTPD